MGLTHRVGHWTVRSNADGSFRHARHNDPRVLIAWTLDDFRVADPGAADEYDRVVSPEVAR